MPDRDHRWLEGVPVHWDTFLDTPPCDAETSKARIVVIPAPYDSTTSYRGGAREGPGAIIRASRHLEDYDLELDRDISEVGIHTAPEIAPHVGSPEGMVERVRRAALSVAEAGKLLALLGGEHTVAIGAVRALAQVHPDLSVLYLDAHADLRDSYMGTRWGHASVARRVYEVCPLVQVGVRSLSADERRFVADAGIPVFFWAAAVRHIGRLAEDVIDLLSPRVYVSVDLDVLDPSVMSAVGTPEPGGMSWGDVTGLLKSVGRRREIVGFDVTELSPNEGPEACAYAAARLAYKLMGYATLCSD